MHYKNLEFFFFFFIIIIIIDQQYASIGIINIHGPAYQNLEKREKKFFCFFCNWFVMSASDHVGGLRSTHMELCQWCDGAYYTPVFIQIIRSL